MNPELLRVLCCPRCYGALVDKGGCLFCSSCAQEYPLREGVPDMRIYESPTCASEFNKQQALYEAQFHDEEARSDYEKLVIGTFGTKTRMMVEDWTLEIGQTPAQSVLDYGCGTGQVSRVVAPHVKPLFAFDISEESLRKNVRDNGVAGVLANSLYLPFKEGAFDVVCINGVLHHIVDLDRAISELARVTAGSVYVSEGIPRGRPSWRWIGAYPGLQRKAAYAGYLVVYWPRALLFMGLRRMKRLAAVLSGGRNGVSKSHGSRYERPLEVAAVEARMEARGFKRKRLRYYTNIDIPGDGALKRMLTHMLVNDVVGTHFDLAMDKDGGDGAEPGSNSRPPQS